MSRFTVQSDRFDRTVCFQQNSTCRSFVTATSLHTYVTVLNDVDTANTVRTGQLVQLFHDGRRRLVDTIDSHRVTVLEGDVQVSRFVWRILGRYRPQPHVFFWLCPWIFDQVTFVRDVQQVGIHRVRRLLAFLLLYVDVVLVTVSHQLFTGVQIPFTPWSDHFNARLKCVGTQLKTYLVVTFTGCTVSNGVSACFVRNFNQTLRDQGTSDRRTQQVLTFVDGVSAEHRENEVAGKLFT